MITPKNGSPKKTSKPHKRDWIDDLADRYGALGVERRMDAWVDRILGARTNGHTPADPLPGHPGAGDDGRRQTSPEPATSAIATLGDAGQLAAPEAAIAAGGGGSDRTAPEMTVRDPADPIGADGDADVSIAANDVTAAGNLPAHLETDKPVASTRKRFGLWQISQALFGEPDADAERVERKRRQALRDQLVDEAWYYMDRILSVTARFTHLSYKYKKSERDWMTSGISTIRFSHAILTPEALYFLVNTLDMPNNVSTKDLADDETLFNLSMACRHQVLAEYEPGKGFWYIVERDSGVRGVPVHVRLDEVWAMRSATQDGLAIPIGIGENKRPIWRSLTDMLSLLIAGTPKSGKSNLMNVMLCTWLRFNAPFRLKLALIDLKGGLEFGHYRDVPHLMRYKPLPIKSKDEALEPEDEAPVENEAALIDNDGRLAGDPELVPALVERREDVLPLLRAVYKEGRRRLKLLRKTGHRDIAYYNWREPKSRYLPHLVVVFDELAELRMLKQDAYEQVMKLIVSIAQLYRAVGIHLVLATQTPKKEVVSTMVKNAIPAYIAFNCPNATASQLIIGNARAVGLSPRGRSIFDYNGQQHEMQTPLITDKTIDKIISMAIRGEFDDIELRRHDVTEDELFRVALEEFNGQLPIEELWKWFQHKQRRIPKAEVREIIVRHIGQEVSVGSSIYRVKAQPGKKAAVLVVVDEQGK